MKFILNTPVLILNANFEPLNVCNVKRAIGLLMKDKASMILNGRGEIHTISKSFPIPSIIRLQYMVKRPRPSVKLCKKEIFRRDNYTCQYCSRKVDYPTLDHVIPRHLGGSHSWSNLVTACPSCNHHKGGKTLDQVPHMKLSRTPKAPPISAQYIFGKYLKENGEWVDFVQGW